MLNDGRNPILLLCTIVYDQATKPVTESIVGQTVGRIVVGARGAVPGDIRDGFIGCVKVSVCTHMLCAISAVIH